uniref:Uncharacterized protein n=1 Tax=Anopheles coluzzii TaxID=1518534 RepID=A0A8W7P7E0_ANOCL
LPSCHRRFLLHVIVERWHRIDGGKVCRHVQIVQIDCSGAVVRPLSSSRRHDADVVVPIVQIVHRLRADEQVGCRLLRLILVLAQPGQQLELITARVHHLDRGERHVQAWVEQPRVVGDKLGHLRGGGSLLVVLVPARLHQTLELWLNACRYRDRVAVLQMLQHLIVGQPLERERSERDDLVQQHPVRPHVRGGRKDAQPERFRCHPAHRQHATPIEPVVIVLERWPGHTEVTELDDTLRIHHTVPAGHIPVDVLLLGQVGERPRHIQRHHREPLVRDVRVFRLLAIHQMATGEQVRLEITVQHKLHHRVDRFRLQTHTEQPDDVVVVEALHRLRLGQKVHLVLRGRAHLERLHRDRRPAFVPDLCLTAVHRAEGTLPQPAIDHDAILRYFPLVQRVNRSGRLRQQIDPELLQILGGRLHLPVVTHLPEQERRHRQDQYANDRHHRDDDHRHLVARDAKNAHEALERTHRRTIVRDVAVPRHPHDRRLVQHQITPEQLVVRFGNVGRKVAHNVCRPIYKLQHIDDRVP